MHIHNISGIYQDINHHLKCFLHNALHIHIQHTDIAFFISLVQIMICTIILRSSGISMGQAMPTVTTDHFTSQAMCFMLSFGTGTCIFFSHGSYFFKILLAYNCFVTIFHTLPFILWKCFCMFIANILNLEAAVNHRAGILLISEDSSYCNIIPERLFLTISGKLLFTSYLHGNIHARRIYSIPVQSF